MKILFALWWTILVVTLGAGPTTPNRYRQSVAVVSTGGNLRLAIGSGYFTTAGVVTAYHVVEYSKVRVGDTPAEVACSRPENDGAVLKTSASGKALNVSPRMPYVGEGLTAAGFPGGKYTEIPVVTLALLENGLGHGSEGRVIAPVLVLLNITQLDIRGMSGGPVIDARGRAVATVVGFGIATVSAVPLVAFSPYCPVTR